MTQVQLAPRVINTSGGASVMVDATYQFKPNRDYVTDDGRAVKSVWSLPISVDGAPVTVNVEPLPAGMAHLIRVRHSDGVQGQVMVTECRQIPQPSGSVVVLDSLPLLDPETLEPSESTVPAWSAAVLAVESASADVLSLDLTGATVKGRQLLRAADDAAVRALIGAAPAGGASKSLVAGDGVSFTDVSSTVFSIGAPRGPMSYLSSIPRHAIRDASVATASGVLRLSYAKAERSFTATKMRVRSGSTAAGATPTLCKLGVFEVAANGDLTRLARTAGDTAMLSATSTAYEYALDAPVTVQAGKTYAFGLLVITSATAPTVQGMIHLTGAEAGWGERLCGQVPAQTDIISSIPGTSVADATANPALYLVA